MSEAINHFTDIRGPQTCPRPCSVCRSGNHHWYSVTFPGCMEPHWEEWDEATKDEAVREHFGDIAFDEDWFDTQGIEHQFAYFVCKHCEAWHPVTEAMLDDDDFDFPV